MGAAGVVMCTASNAAYGQALSFLRFGGTLVCVGVPEGDPVPIAGADPASLLIQEKRIVGSAVGNRKDAIETMNLAARGIVSPFQFSFPLWYAPIYLLTVLYQNEQVKTHFTVEPMSKVRYLRRANPSHRFSVPQKALILPRWHFRDFRMSEPPLQTEELTLEHMLTRSF